MFISKGLAFEVEFVLIKEQFVLDWEMTWRFMKLIFGERKLYIFYIVAQLCTISISLKNKLSLPDAIRLKYIPNSSNMRTIFNQYESCL